MVGAALDPAAFGCLGAPAAFGWLGATRIFGHAGGEGFAAKPSARRDDGARPESRWGYLRAARAGIPK